MTVASRRFCNPSQGFQLSPLWFILDKVFTSTLQKKSIIVSINSGSFGGDKFLVPSYHKTYFEVKRLNHPTLLVSLGCFRISFSNNRKSSQLCLFSDRTGETSTTPATVDYFSQGLVFIRCFHQFVSRIFPTNFSQFEQLNKKINFILVKNRIFSQFAS